MSSNEEEKEETPKPLSESCASEALKAALGDDEMTNVKLQGTDGEQVPANRGILSARSKVFRKMLMGKFEEGTCPIVAVGYPGAVIRSVVEYCYSDDATLFCSENLYSEGVANTIVSLSVAADYFHLRRLDDKVAQWVSDATKSDAALACSFLNRAKAAGGSAFGVEEGALRSIRCCPRALLEKKCVACLDPSALETVVKDEHMQTDEFAIFQLLQTWAEADDTNANLGDVSAAGATQGHSRHEIARNLVGHIRLENLAPSELAGVVASSGLVTAETLVNAFKAHALKAEKCEDSYWYFKKPRCYVKHKWNGSLSDIASYIGTGSDSALDTIQHRGMKVGTFRWAVKVLSHKSTRIGVALKGTDDTMELDGFGCLFVHGQKESTNNSRFREGDTLTFTLEIQEDFDGGEEFWGTLHCSVNDRPPKLLFAGSKWESGQLLGEVALVPCVSLKHNDRVQFVGFLPVD